MLIPRTYKVRHQVLSFLATKRKAQLTNSLTGVHAQFSAEQIAQAINVKKDLVDQQLYVLWDSKEITDTPSDGTFIKKFMALPQGISTAGSKKILNDGRAFNAQLFNNYASGIFQILIGLIAVYTIYTNFTSIAQISSKLSKTNIKLEILEERIKALESNLIIENFVSDTVANPQIEIPIGANLQPKQN